MRPCLSRRAILTLSAASFAVALVALAMPASSQARQRYATATGQPCSTCHVNIATSDDRNAFGRAFGAIPTHSTDPAGAYAQLTGSAAPAPAQPGSPSAAPAFRLGFAALAAQIPSIVGVPLEDEHYAANGDSQQRTTTGLMVWRKADNWTAFTNGYMTWVNGPFGIQQRSNADRFPWEADDRGGSAPRDRGEEDDRGDRNDTDRLRNGWEA